MVVTLPSVGCLPWSKTGPDRTGKGYEMKLDAATVEALRERIAPLDTDEVRQAYRDGRFPRADKVRDLDRRYRWDLFYAARGGDIVQPDAGRVTDSRGITSDHIDTVLRRIVAPLGN